MSILANERGAILLFALGAMLSLLLIAAASSMFTRGDQRLTVNLRDATRALFIAEAGMGWAQNQLRGGDAALYFTDSASVSPTPTSFGSGTYRVTIGTRDALGSRDVASAGEYGGIERTVSARLRHFRLDPQGTNDCFLPGDADSDGVCDSKLGIVAAQDVSVSGGSTIDSFLGDPAGYGFGTAKTHGNVAANGTITLAGSGTVVRGGVYVGRDLVAGTNTLTQAPVSLPTLHLPPLPGHAAVCSGHTNPALVDCNPPFGTVTTVLAGSPPNQSLTVGSGQTICMPPGVYCFRQVVVQSGGILRVVEPATGLSVPWTVIQVDGSAGGTAFQVLGRVEYGSGMRPSHLRVFSRGEVEILGWSGAQVQALVYAPRSRVRLNTNNNGNRMQFFGAVYGDRVTLGGGPVEFHVDEAALFGDFCANASDPLCEPAFVIRPDWSELRS